MGRIVGSPGLSMNLKQIQPIMRFRSNAEKCVVLREHCGHICAFADGGSQMMRMS
jgi:hypothetical protein